jgi:hypothetical protein
MLMPHPPSPLSLGAEHGTTLMEMLVTMLAGIIVLGALLATLEFSLRQEAQISDRVQSNRIGRLAMTKMVDELHSACTGFGATAIQAPPAGTVTAPLASTGPVDLWFLSAYGNASSGKAVPIPSEHDVHWEATGALTTAGRPLGTLTDYSFANTGGEAPTWTFPKLETKNATARLLAANVIPPAIEVEGKKALFQYYDYNASGQLEILKWAEIPHSVEEQEVAKVAIGFTQAPENGNTQVELDRTAAFSDSVVLRFNPSETGSEANNDACA